MLSHNNYQGAQYGYQPGTRYVAQYPSSAQLQPRIAQQGEMSRNLQSSYTPSFVGTRAAGAPPQSAQVTTGQPGAGQYYFPHDSVRHLRAPPSLASMGMASAGPTRAAPPLPARQADVRMERVADVRMEIPGRAYTTGVSQITRPLPQAPQYSPPQYSTQMNTPRKFVSDVDVDTSAMVPYRTMPTPTPGTYRLVQQEQPLRQSQQVVSDVEDYSMPAQSWGGPRHPEVQVQRAPMRSLFPEYNPGNMPLDFLCKSLVPLASGITDLRAVFGPLPASQSSSRSYATENRGFMGTQPTWTDWLVENLKRDPTYNAALEREKRSSPPSNYNSRRSTTQRAIGYYGGDGPSYDPPREQSQYRDQSQYETPAWAPRDEPKYQAPPPEREYQYQAPPPQPHQPHREYRHEAPHVTPQPPMPQPKRDQPKRDQPAAGKGGEGPAEDVASQEHQYAGQKFLHSMENNLGPLPAGTKEPFKAPSPPASNSSAPAVPPVPPRPAPQALPPSAVGGAGGGGDGPKVGKLGARLAAYQQAASEVT
mmetsp:Transcript_13933/g.32775  ORF Transcript_13933/g.32775 Transcript_13933/m.32775 type:complete len:534 (+) Transcript_13933:152-1753(+)|eukprot:CAMPEP_0177725886 /NCGR_PEP_ID=MMETSP0484_2-20121128/19486_1 /TAXON_ID=354590 /ORGANISM="Rhodomonas lens, Strain RHODO" /LENGTH=533 /DNA_ID=CAMNT_0019238421 /DNA_START=151 /DNA_END=1752 /DNA_ORIENTATION=+